MRAPPVGGFCQIVGGVISPLLSNIYLHVLDAVWERRYAHLGVLVRYADDFVVMCRTHRACEEAETRVRGILERLGLRIQLLHRPMELQYRLEQLG